MSLRQSQQTASEGVRSGGTWLVLRRLLPWAVIALALLALAYRSWRFGGHFPDDAFITFRFAENLVRGFGIVWNIDGPPTEGSTSILQTILVATTMRLGLPLLTGAYLISTVSVLVLVLVLVRIAARLNGRLTLAAALPLALYLGSARFSVHVNSGMDTIVAAALLSTSFLVSLHVLSHPRRSLAVALALVSLLCLWSRPDTAPFLAGQGVVLGLVAIMRRRHGDSGMLGALFLAYGIVGAIGTAYLAWKYAYFGYLLPNSFYVKTTENLAFGGLADVLRFTLNLAKKAVYLAPLILFLDWRALATAGSRTSWSQVALLCVPMALVLFYNSTTLHVVNYHHRLEFPVEALFWVAVGWLLASGKAFERLQVLIGRFSGPTVAVMTTAGFAVVVLAITMHLDRRHHRPWFARVQWHHYEPMAAALIRAGGGPEVTLVYDAAGYIPFTSRVSFIDPVGLVDNVLSGREPITPIEREQYIWGSRPDAYLGPVPPASTGATSAAEEPLWQTAYAENVLLSRKTLADYGRAAATMSDGALATALHYRMRELRDNWISVGEFPYPWGISRDYTHFLYVRKGSPYEARLVEEFSRLTTRTLEDVDFDDVTDGQVLITREDARRLSALP